MSRKGRAKPNVAGERYDSNAIPIPGATTTARSNSNRTRPLPGFPADLLSGLGGMGGGMPDMGQMMDMMQKMGMGGGMGGMPGMMGGDGGIPGMPGMSGMMPPVAPALPKILYHNLPEGTPIDKLFTFYPTYINAKRTVQQGRRIIKEAACDDPLAVEMSEVCAFFNLPHVLEPGKKYARDWDVSGRIRVRLVNDNGSFTHPEIHTRKQLMVKMGELIPKLQSRKVRLEKEASAITGALASGSSSSSGNPSKKKGKKGKGKR